MSIRSAAAVAVLSVGILSGRSAALAETPYVADPDPDRPTLHAQPPLLVPRQRALATKSPASVINGVTYVDVMLSAGFDLSGYDLGNEPALTANPLNPNQIVMTSFSGSDWPTGGNSSIWYSVNGGANWEYDVSIPPPTGTATNYACPCDQNMDWGRNGTLYGTFLHYDATGTVSTVFSAETTNPSDPLSWVYRSPGGLAQTTNQSSLIYPDQPWLWSGPGAADNSQTNVCVAYDNFDSAYTDSEIRAADSPGASPPDFSIEGPINADALEYNDGMNPGNRIAVGPDGKIFNVFQRLVSTQANGVKQLTYLITVSVDGGVTWEVGNSDHASGAKIVAANVFSFQGNGSKVGTVNALLGGIDAIATDPKTGAAWVVYGARPTLTSHDQLYLVKVTYSAGRLTVGTPVTLTSAAIDNYLPSVAVLPNGEVGILFLTLNVSTFQWRFAQYSNGVTIVKTTPFPSFTSPFTDNTLTNQRIFGDYVQARGAGCTFFGAYPARGAGANDVSSIVPYFMSAPAATACALPALTTLVPAAVCAGGPAFALTVKGSGFTNGATGRIGSRLRTTTYASPTQVSVGVAAPDIATSGIATIDLLGAAPAGGLASGLALSIELPAGSPADTLRGDKDGTDVGLSWTSPAGVTSYNVRRCDATLGPCVPSAIAAPASNAYADGVLLDGATYWYAVESVNSCGPVP